MASGDLVASPRLITPPGASFAELRAIAGGSTPAERYFAYFFDGDGNLDEYYDVHCVMSGTYGGGGVTVSWPIKPDTATSGNMRPRAAFRRLRVADEDIDTSHTYDFNVVTVAAPATLGHLVLASISFTNGADMDSVEANDSFVLRIGRNASDTTNDTMAGDAGFLLELLKVVEA